MALNDVFQVTDVQLYNGGEELINTYFYQRNVPGGNAQNLALAFAEDMLPKIVQLQTTQITHQRLVVINLGDLEDFYDYVLLTNNVGLTAMPSMPAFVAYNYTLRAASRAVRPGSKRIAGVGEEAVTNGIVDNATVLGRMETLRLAFDDVITQGADILYTPVIVKRIPYTTPSGKAGYRLPETNAELVAPAVTSATVNTRVSHQVSRGNGR